MAADPPEEHLTQPDGEAPGRARRLPPPPERTRFGGSPRRQERAHEDDAPVSRSDLSKGPQELLESRTSRTNWIVLLISSLVILVFSIWTSLLPDVARATMKTTVDWIANSLG